MQTVASILEDAWELDDVLHDVAKAAKVRDLRPDEIDDLSQICGMADQISARCLSLGARRPPEIKSGLFPSARAALAAQELVTSPSVEVKAIGDSGWTQGYAVKFGDESSAGDFSQFGDIFQPPPKTYYGRNRQIEMHVHHGMIDGFGKRELTNLGEITIDPVGVFVKHLLDLRDPYEKALFELTKRGKLGYSSGSSPYLVERKAISGRRHLISRWPIHEISYTPSPAGGMAVQASAAIKSLLAGVGYDTDAARADRILRELAALEAAQPRRKRLVPGPTSGSMVEVEI